MFTRVDKQRDFQGVAAIPAGWRQRSSVALCHAFGVSPFVKTTVRRCGLVAFVALTVALAGCGDETPPVAKLSAAEVQTRLAEQPAVALAPAAQKLEAKAGELIDTDGDPVAALDDQVKALRGTPVVVNLWADWCKPCKVEMPILQRLALDQRGKVAFLGVASSAAKAKNQAYLEQIALPYPSLVDEDGKVLDGTGVDGLPKTIFYDAAGKRTVHNGPYDSEADLLADIQRYAR